jgi:hypothetical protein
MSDRSPAPEDVGDQRGSEPDMSDTAEFAKMRAVMRASEKHREGGWIQNSRTRTQIPAPTPEPWSGGAQRKRSSVKGLSMRATDRRGIRQMYGACYPDCVPEHAGRAGRSGWVVLARSFPAEGNPAAGGASACGFGELYGPVRGCPQDRRRGWPGARTYR